MNRSRRTAPLLLLAGVIGGWAVLRTGFLAIATPVPDDFDMLVPGPSVPQPADDWLVSVLPGSPRLASPPPDPMVAGLARRGSVSTPRLLPPPPLQRAAQGATTIHKPTVQPSPILIANQLLLARMLAPLRPAHSASLASVVDRHSGAAAEPDYFIPAAAPARSSWSGSAWLALRDGTAVPGLGQAALGGSQAGVRLAWQPAQAPVALFGRVVSSGPLRRGGAEAALGIAARPLRSLPVDLVAEWRVALSAPGRDAFAAYAVTGGQRQLGSRGWRLDGYGAAGVVGARRRDLFVEGAARVDRPVAEIGRVVVRAGGGVWGAAQPGAARLDLGPTLSADVRGAAASPRLALDWRQRVAGDAVPPSGPALTLAVDF